MTGKVIEWGTWRHLEASDAEDETVFPAGRPEDQRLPGPQRAYPDPLHYHRMLLRDGYDSDPAGAVRLDLERFGNALRVRRMALGLTQPMLSDRMGWPAERISLLERGEYGVPTVRAQIQLADALGMSIVDLLTVLGVPRRLLTGAPAWSEPFAIPNVGVGDGREG